MPTEEPKKTERDTHFQGFAKLLFADLDSHDFLWLGVTEEPEALQIIAQRAYDFARHLLAQLLLARDIEQELHSVPDMTEWPEQEKEVATGEMNAWQHLETEMGEPFAVCLRHYLTETCHILPTDLVTWEIDIQMTDVFRFEVVGECYHAIVKLTFPDKTGVQCKMKNVHDVWSIMP